MTSEYDVMAEDQQRRNDALMSDLERLDEALEWWEAVDIPAIGDLEPLLNAARAYRDLLAKKCDGSSICAAVEHIHGCFADVRLTDPTTEEEG